MRITDLKPGWAVITNDGHRIGKIREVGQHFLKVSGHPFAPDLFVPSSAIANVEHESVHLNVATGEVDAMGWNEPPRMPDALLTKPEPESTRDI